jgi:putative colanic acid biosynthesis UDP-glucose lipid carrier transferase
MALQRSPAHRPLARGYLGWHLALHKTSQAMAEHTAPIRFRRASTLTLGWNNLLHLVEALLDPVVLVLSLWAVALYTEGRMTPLYLVLSLLVFSLTFPGTARLEISGWRLARDILFSWGSVAAILLLLGYVSGYIDLFDRETILVWLALAPACQLAVHTALRRFAPSLLRMPGEPRRVVIAGVNEHGLALARQIVSSPYISDRLIGFFDDRDDGRIVHPEKFALLGTLGDMPRFVRENRVQVIYLSLPMATQPRILQLLDELADTTVSIYFVPDMFLTDLMQGRIDSVGDIPVVAVCETPFSGINSIVKRASDIVLAGLILALISPLMLLIAAAVKLDSPGPVIFRQRRYGLDGEEIFVSKFRSMKVCEDGGTIRQAQKNDPRVTRLGAFLRKTSLDELPQFFNVLQGRMSIVGPRPHAVAHNELYRKLIKGYMVRHKVKPGITGWAQINGYRGETDTLDKMKGRIDYDLAYLRNWSLRLDLYIILKTLGVVLKDRNAY